MVPAPVREDPPLSRPQRSNGSFTSYLLLQLGFPALEIDAEEGEGRTRYIAAMRAADQFDLEPLSRLIATAVSEAMAQDALSPDFGET
jgi:hypothetical protein